MEEMKALVRRVEAGLGALIDKEDEIDENLAANTAGRRRLGTIVLAVGTVLTVAVLTVGVFVWRFVSYAYCTTDRTKALSGPGNERVSLFLGAFTASVTVQHLSAKDRAEDLAVLRKAREGRYPLIPSEADLAKLPDAQIAGDAQAVLALDKNTEYNAALRHHPVCNLWGF